MKKIREIDILYTPSSKNFDRLCRLAAQMFDVPIAAVTFLDADIQWFKSKVGLEISSTPRELAFCNHTILRNDVLVVENASHDSRFAEHPMVTGEPHIRFYAGAPIPFNPRVNLGAICVIDKRPKTATDLQRAALKQMGESLGTELRYLHAMAMLREMQARECPRTERL